MHLPEMIYEVFMLEQMKKKKKIGVTEEPKRVKRIFRIISFTLLRCNCSFVNYSEFQKISLDTIKKYFLFIVCVLWKKLFVSATDLRFLRAQWFFLKNSFCITTKHNCFKEKDELKKKECLCWKMFIESSS